MPTSGRFIGEVEHAIDDDAERRRAGPARVRRARADGLAITRGLDRCLASENTERKRATAPRMAGQGVRPGEARRL